MTNRIYDSSALKTEGITVVEFVGSGGENRAVVHYSDGKQRVIIRRFSPEIYRQLHEQLTPPALAEQDVSRGNRRSFWGYEPPRAGISW